MRHSRFFHPNRYCRISLPTTTCMNNVDSSDNMCELTLYVISGYQALLLCGLNKYLISEERKTDIFSQNKEGIFSIFGEDLSVVWVLLVTYPFCLFFTILSAIFLNWSTSNISMASRSDLLNSFPRNISENKLWEILRLINTIFPERYAIIIMWLVCYWVQDIGVCILLVSESEAMPSLERVLMLR